jgi:hypothetical protein
MADTLRTISYGGGVQSTALVVLAALRDPKFEEAMGGRVEHALFSNVGDDSEHPATLEFVRDVMTPWAAERGVTVHELRRTRKDGELETLYGRITRPGHRAITIPLYGEGGVPQSRHCTADFKVAVLAKWLKANGANKDNPATVAIGISVDELERAHRGRDEPWERRCYPLLDLAMNRGDCEQFIAKAGLPVPQKSSCWFCPFHKPQTWAEMRRDQPRMFEAAVALEGMVLARQRAIGHSPLFLTRFGRPLDEAIGEAQTPLFEADGPQSCDSGYCWT